MALTNFAALTPEQKLVWSRDVWSAARDQMFIKRFMGTSDNSMIQRITELTRTEKGEQVLMQLVADLVGDGVVGDNEREGNEEELKSYSDIITIDTISNQVINKGKLADQKTVINFREHGRNKLAYWLANRTDQLALLTLSNISYAYELNGKLRTESAFPSLAFAADVASAPSSKRHLRWDVGTPSTLVESPSTGDVAAGDYPTYQMVVDACAYAKSHYVKPLMAGGREYYVLMMHPLAIAKLKRDQDFQRALTTAAPRGLDNPWFTGASVTIDGAVIHEHRLVFNTSGAASGSKWGGGTVDGTRTLLCGAQALGMADLGPPEWVEKKFQYDSQQGISVDKMFGLLKPKFHSIYDGSVQDFGCLCIDHAL